MPASRRAGTPTINATGTYNARRDGLRGQFWRRVFGVTHGLMIVDRFYENVDRDGKNAVLESSRRIATRC